MAAVTPPSSHNLTFPNPKFSCSSAKRPPTAFPSQSFPRASDSLRFLCHSNSSDSSSSQFDRSEPWRWDSAIQDFVKTAIQSFDSYVNSQKKEQKAAEGRERKGVRRDVGGDEWDWDRWKKHFEEIDEQERLISVLKSQLGRAVRVEDYEEAGRIKVAIAAAATRDAVGQALHQLNRAIAEERYRDAMFVRDNASAGLVGWWAGISEDTKHPYGIIIRITAEHGRYVARSYSPRQLTRAAAGVPLFEIFLKMNENGEYKEKAVYLKQREDFEDMSSGSFKGFDVISNLKPLDSSEGKTDLIFTSIEEEDEDEDSNGVEDGSDLPEELPGFKNILRDVVPGVRVKVLKVTAPEKVDKDLIAKVIEQIMEEEDEDEDEEEEEEEGDEDEDEEEEEEEEEEIEVEMAEGLESKSESKAENDQEEGILEIDADLGVLEGKGPNEFAVKVVIGGLVQKLSSNVSSGDLHRVPAKLEKKGRSSFSFHMEKEIKHGDIGGKKQASSSREAKLKGQRSIDHVMLDLAKFIGGEKIPLRVLKDVGELISLTLDQAQNHRRLSRSTDFNRIDMSGTLDPLNGLYIGAHGIYTSEVIHLRRRLGQWHPDTKTDNLPNLELYEYVEALKLTGDRYVPAGEVAFRAKVGKRYQLPHKGIIPEELGVIARYKGQGRLAEPGFKNPRWVDGELVILDGKYIKGGPVVGFVYWAPEYHFLVFFNRLRLPE